ncbi:MAG: Chromosome partition protein Smc [Parcubacteria group bacterium GW2011_GWA2_53_21]|nr:MAG: Chromosome partition protein Smc [Parcubacteria group bacterium GW2011_GWA2_53_21]
MYLERLEIQGFKSFAAKTVLDFLPPKDGLFSITGVVGPNGAGKSNITDAIRWVMGETSMKNVRAKKNEDVIFNGSESKGSLSAAEVTMTLDNASGDTGLDFPEIVITRRLYRTGESEYLVNNNLVRLIDIHLLLARAKFAEGAYSIVSQGMIDRLLTVTPAERKDFFDEACGIKEHQIKQHQAALKLARTEENIKQAETLLAEVEPRLKILHKQVKKLDQRHDVEARLLGTQEQYYYTIYHRNKIEIDAIKSNLTVVETRYRATFAELENIQTELSELARGSSRQEVFDELQVRYQEAIRAKNEVERELVIIEGQMQTQYSQSGQQNIGWLEGKVTELKQNEDRLTAQASAAAAEVRRREEAAETAKKQSENLGVEATQIRLKISRLQGELMKDQSEQSYRELSGLTAVKAVLEARNKFGKVHGLVAELGDVPEEYRLALEVAAGSHLSSIVVENEEVARLAISYLRENRFGVATFLPLNKIQPRPNYSDGESLLGQSGMFGKAIDLIKFDDKFDAIFSMIFGDTLVVTDLKAAERLGIGRARMVTLEGDLVERCGIMRGGWRNKRNALGFSSKISLSSQDRLAELQQAIVLETHNMADIERQIEQAKSKLVDLTIEAKTSAHQATATQSEFEANKRELARLEHELKLVKASPEEYGEQLTALAEKKEDFEKQKGARAKAAAKIAAEIEQYNRKEEEKKQRVFSLQVSMQKKQDEVNRILSERNDWRVETAKLETKQEDLAQEVLNDMKVSIHSLTERVATPVDAGQLESLAKEIENLKYQLSLIGGIDEEVVEEYGATKEKYDFLTSQLADLGKATGDLQKMIEELDELMKKRRSVAFKKIRKDFSRYFAILFDGGNADLEEIYGEPPVEEIVLPDGTIVPAEEQTAEGGEAPKRKNEKILTGIEVIANPPGKKVKYLNMLSGGERTLTSIALISAILFHNPSPFVVLDEVEAALDEANTLRFVKILSELSTHCQFIVVTHNRVTMHAAGSLYGVVMGADGVSKLLSVTMADAPQYAEAMTVDKTA